MRRSATLAALATATTLLVALLAGPASAEPAAGAEEGETDTVVLQLRIWQRVTDPEELWLSARQTGGRWDELGTFRLPEGEPNHVEYLPADEYPSFARIDNVTITYGEPGPHPRMHQMIRVGLAGVDLRIWQRLRDPSLIFVQVLRVGYSQPRYWNRWRPLGTSPVRLEDGFSPLGSYRYGNLAIAVPRTNPALRADREHLLAMRDVLEGDGAELNWSLGHPAAEWEGVTLGGTPLRVTGLDLANRELNGEIWGWLGELEELTELRLDGNALTGTIPSKLALLSNLTIIRLGGNALSGCIPRALRQVADHDLDALGLTDCAEPIRPWPATRWNNLPSGTYRLYDLTPTSCLQCAIVFDVPPQRSVSLSFTCYFGGESQLPRHIFEGIDCGYGLHDAADNDIWAFVDIYSGLEVERSHYSGCVYDCGTNSSPAAFIEQIAASAWHSLRTVQESGVDDRD